MTIQRGRVWNMFHVISMMRQLGLEWITEDGKPNFDDHRAVAAMEVYASLFHTDAIDPSADWKAFAEGRAAMYPGASYQHKHFTMTSQRESQFQVATTPYPRLETGKLVSPSYAWGFYVTKTAKDPHLAWKIAHFFAGPHFADRWFKERALLIPYKGPWLQEIYETEPAWREFLNALMHAQVEPLHPEYNEISKRVNQAEMSVVAREKDAKSALATLNQEVTALLQEKGK